MPPIRLPRAALALGVVVAVALGAAGCASDAGTGAAASTTASPSPTPATPSTTPPPRSTTPSPSTPASPPTSMPPPAEEQQVPPGPQRVLFFGDSYVVGGGYTGAEDSMAALAARRLGWEYRIRGGGGTGFATANPEYDLPDYLEQVDDGALDVGPVDWLVVEGGGNDYAVDPDVLTRAAVRTLAEATRRHPEARVVLLASMDPTVADFSDSDGRTEALARAAREAGVAFVDAQRWLVGRPDLVGPDFVHPLPEGHELCGEKLAAALTDLA